MKAWMEGHVTPATETEIEGVRHVARVDGRSPDLQPMVLVVSGPDRDDEICLIAGSECFLTRQATIELIQALATRLMLETPS